MKTDIKSGQEILDEFFSELAIEEELDTKTVQLIVELYKDGRLSDRNVLNNLAEMREEANDGKDK